MNRTTHSNLNMITSFVSDVGDDDMELESHSELDSKSSRDSIETELKSADLKTDRFVCSFHHFIKHMCVSAIYQ